MKYIALLFFILGLLVYKFIPTDSIVPDARPIDVSQVWANSVSDESGCINETQIKDVQLAHGEKITAENKEVCQ